MIRMGVGGLVLGLLLAWPPGLAAGEAAPPPEAQIKAWIAQLGGEDFDTREHAEAALRKAGPAAIPLLTKARDEGDAEVKARAARILDELRWATQADFKDLAAILPADTALLVHTPDMKGGLARLRAETPLGKLYDHAALATLKSALGEMLLAGPQVFLKMPADWFDHYGTPLGLSLIRMDRQLPWPEREQFGFFFGTTDPDQAKAFNAFQELFPMQGNTVREMYRGIPYTYSTEQYSRDVLARIRNLIVRASGQAALKTVVDGASGVNAPGLAKSAGYIEGLAKTDPAPLGLLYFSMENLAKNAFSQREQTAVTALGFSEWKTAVVTLNARDGLFAERAFCKVEGERQGFAKLLSFRKSTAKWAALCPPDALAFVDVPLEAKALYETILSMVEGVDANDAAQFKETVAKWEEGLKVKLVEGMLSGITGEAAVWATRPAGPNPAQPPDLYAVFETRDAEAAQTVSQTLVKLIPLASGKEDLLGTVEYQGRKCHWIKKDAWDADFPYVFSWCADGARLLAASSGEGLLRLIGRAETKPAGLDAKPDFKRLFEATPADERGGLAYVNAAELLDWGYTVGLPVLSAEAPEELKGKLADAPKSLRAILADFPGTLLAITGTPDGVRARAAGGVPVSGLVTATPFAFFTLAVRPRMRAQVQRVQAEAQVKVEEKKEAAEPKPKQEEKAEAEKKAKPKAAEKAEPAKAEQKQPEHK